jgi:Tfp pilus assembly protein PilP
MRSLTFAILALAVAASAQTPKTTATAPKTTASTTKSTMPAPKSTAPAAKTTSIAKTSTAKMTAAPAKAPVTAPAKTSAKTAAPAPKSAAKAPAKAMSASAKTHTAAKPVPKAPAKTSAKTAAPAKKSEIAKSIAPEMARSRRDPFISPIRLQEDRMKSNPACTTGARCLVISQVVLKGVVKTQNGWIAMVENGAKKEYNLHEKDTVQNGVVTKITGDSIVFTETVTDPLGRPVSREVVKRVTAPVV